MNNLESKLNGASFNTIGTNANSYIEKYIKSIGNIKSFLIYNWKLIDKNNNDFLSFTSESTTRQFINTLIAFGFIELGVGKYIVKKNKFNFEHVTKNIFKYDSNKVVNSIRQSRIISFLYKVDLINSSNFKKLNIKGKKGLTKEISLKREASRWEIEAAKDSKKEAMILKKIIEDYKFEKRNNE
ncbi:MAG: hypothetical protein NC236_02915 [Mycoplasma sp.]|nr:hypothetical protein [Mycoplasma sp.]